MRRASFTHAIVATAAIAGLTTTTTATAASLAEFGRCLAREGAVFYGASWCPHCRSQREALGDAMSSVRYVECAVDGRRDATASACTSAKVDSFPTWVFKDGSRASGAQTLARLAARTGCALPAGSEQSGASGKKKKADDSNPPSGPKIIEIPQE